MNTTFGNIFTPINESYCDNIDWGSVKPSSILDLLESQYESFYFVESVLNILECTNILNESESEDTNEKKFNFKEFLNSIAERVKKIWDNFIGFIKTTYEKFANKIHELYLNNNLFDKYFIKKSEKFDYSIIDKAAEIAKNDDNYDVDIDIVKTGFGSWDFYNERGLMTKLISSNIEKVSDYANKIRQSSNYSEAKKLYNDLLDYIKSLKENINNNYVNPKRSSASETKNDVKQINNGKTKLSPENFDTTSISKYSSSKFEKYCKDTIGIQEQTKKIIDGLKKDHIQKPDDSIKVINKEIELLKKGNNIITRISKDLDSTEYTDKYQDYRAEILGLQSDIQRLNLDIFINNSICKKVMQKIITLYQSRIFSVFYIYSISNTIVKKANKANNK